MGRGVDVFYSTELGDFGDAADVVEIVMAYYSGVEGRLAEVTHVRSDDSCADVFIVHRAGVEEDAGAAGEAAEDGEAVAYVEAGDDEVFGAGGGVFEDGKMEREEAYED